MTATIDIYTSRSAFPSAPTSGTLAVLNDAVNRTSSLWVFIAGAGWQRAAHAAFTGPGD